MDRTEFTQKICSLINEMIAQGERPVGDYWKRSDEEQMHLFQEGKSKCDGIHNISQHQRGTALDIYFLTEDHLHITEPKKGHEYWHKEWENKGGQPMISWDRGHFEG